MGSTITEKILARAAGKDAVQAGDIIEARVDLALANDITAPLAIAEFEKAGFTKVFDPARIALVPDHFTPNKDIKAAGQSKKMREFARSAWDRQLLRGRPRRASSTCCCPTLGLVAPGDVVIGADSHTCTYGAAGAPSAPAWAAPTSPPPWPGATYGCACRRASSSSITASSSPTSRART